MADYGWQYNAELVAALYRFPLEQAYQLPAVEFLNGLAYLKAKRAHEKEIRQKPITTHE